MDSTVFKNDETYYFGEFYKVLQLLVFSCEKMILEKKIKLNSSQEDNLRNLFVIEYLRKNKDKFGIMDLYFNCGGESVDKDNNYKTLGRVDINISVPNTLCSEDKIFIFECKRLDGYSSKNKEYVNNGLFRFIEGKYSKKMPLAGMIGFVQGFKKNSNMNSLVVGINDILNKHKTIKTTKNLTLYKIDKKFKYSYSSQHKRNKSLPKIDLYHLFFDFTTTSQH